MAVEGFNWEESNRLIVFSSASLIHKVALDPVPFGPMLPCSHDPMLGAASVGIIFHFDSQGKPNREIASEEGDPNDKATYLTLPTLVSYSLAGNYQTKESETLVPSNLSPILYNSSRYLLLTLLPLLKKYVSLMMKQTLERDLQNGHSAALEQEHLEISGSEK